MWYELLSIFHYTIVVYSENISLVFCIDAHSCSFTSIIFQKWILNINYLLLIVLLIGIALRTTVIVLAFIS